MATEAPKVENAEVKVEDVKVDQPASEEMPELENAGDAQAKGANKQSKNEKKSRKAVQKLGLKPVTGITRVTLKKGKQVRVKQLSLIFIFVFILLYL
jgi:nascent polypeptide-associated complex subunit alpha